MIPEARHVGIDEIPWVENKAYPGTWMRLLQANLDDGVYAMHGKMSPGLSVGTHRHTGAVFMITYSGSWRYLEHEYVNRAGSYLYEPPGSIHTLEVPASNTELTEVHTILYGKTEYLDAAGEVVAVSDAAATLQNYYESCEAAGISRPNAILR